MDLADVKLGSEGDVKVGIEGGKLVLSLVHVHASGEVTLVVKEDAKYFLEKLKAVIPGNWDDLVINVIEGALP